MKQQADQEFVAMRRIIETLSKFDGPGRQRVMDYVNARVPYIADQPASNQPSVPVQIVAQPGLPLASGK